MIRKYGRGIATPSANAYSRTRGGRRADLNNKYFRSAWEANYARYLNFLISRGEIKRWEYEAQVFIFPGVKRGTLSYLPDFKVVNLDDSVEWHEVKGWLDAKSKTQLKRMAKYYPSEHIVLIDGKRYRDVAKWRTLIPNWE